MTGITFGCTSKLLTAAMLAVLGICTSTVPVRFQMRATPKWPSRKTNKDNERIKKAEEKRARKNAKRLRDAV